MLTHSSVLEGIWLTDAAHLGLAMSYVNQTFHIGVGNGVSWPVKDFQSFPHQDRISSLKSKNPKFPSLK